VTLNPEFEEYAWVSQGSLEEYDLNVETVKVFKWLSPKSLLWYNKVNDWTIVQLLTSRKSTTKPSYLDAHTAAYVAELFRSFSDTSRVRLLYAIKEQEMNTSSLAELVGLTESAVFHHLRSLRQQRLVHSGRVGKVVFCQVMEEHIIALFQ
jgi:DNA-binding transcriptional ArsR family regulator